MNDFIITNKHLDKIPEGYNIVFSVESNLESFCAKSNLIGLIVDDYKNGAIAVDNMSKSINFVGRNSIKFDDSIANHYKSPIIHFSKASSINFIGFDFSNLVSLDNIFAYNTSVQSMYFSKCNFGNIWSMQRTFASCYKLRQIEIVDSVVAPVIKDISGLFDDCTISYCDLTGLNLSKLEKMAGTFKDANIDTLVLPDNFDTKLVYDFSEAFYQCRNCGFSLSKLDTRTAIDMSYMFYASNLPEYDLRSFDTSNVADMEKMFACVKASKINLSNFKFNNSVSLKSFLSMCNADILYGNNNILLKEIKKRDKEKEILSNIQNIR